MLTSASRTGLLSGLALFALSLLPAEEKITFTELPVEGGKVYKECTVIETDAEGFLIRHAGGVSRISFFDVDEKIQEQFNFDPVEALRIYKIRQEVERARRKQLLLEAEKMKAAIARENARIEREEIARKEWPPVLAQVVHRSDAGLFVNAQRIEFVPTKTISTLGFELDGPPKRVLKPFSRTLIFLEGAKLANEGDKEWRGYVDPVSLKNTSHPQFPHKSVPVHLAVPPQ